MGGDRKYSPHPVVPSDQAPLSSTFSPRSPSVCKESPCSDTDRFKCVCHALASPDALLLTALWKQRCFSSRSGASCVFVSSLKQNLSSCWNRKAAALWEEGSVQNTVGSSLFYVSLQDLFVCLSRKSHLSWSALQKTPHRWLSAGSIQSQSLLCMLLNETSTAESYYAGTPKQTIRKQLGETWLKPQAGTGGSYEWGDLAEQGWGLWLAISSAEGVLTSGRTPL